MIFFRTIKRAICFSDWNSCVQFVASCLVKGTLAANRYLHKYSPRPVVPGGAKGAMVPQDFGTLVNPISTRVADYAPHITTGNSGFSDLPTALKSIFANTFDISDFQCNESHLFFRSEFHNKPALVIRLKSF